MMAASPRSHREAGVPSVTSPSADRTVLHVDCNCFFVSCHVARDAGLAGRAVAVAGDPARRSGVVLSASYEARRFGIQGAMPLARALALCPGLVVLAPDFALYRERSAQVLGLLREYSPQVEPFSIDEAWLDLGGCSGLVASPAAAAQQIQRRARCELGLPVSIGIAENKLLAKMASGRRKPEGITTLRRADVPLCLWPLPVEDLFGVGPALGRRLASWNVRTIGDLAALGPDFCERRLGLAGRRLWAAAHGRDDSPVDPQAGGRPRSIGSATTLGRDVRTLGEARPILLGLVEKVARRLRQHELAAAALTVTMRSGDFRDSTRTSRLPAPTDLTMELFEASVALAQPRLDGAAGYRLLGVTAQDLRPAAAAIRRPSLLDGGAGAREVEARRALDRAGDAIRERFGEGALMPAALLPARTGSPRQAG